MKTTVADLIGKPLNYAVAVANDMEVTVEAVDEDADVYVPDVIAGTKGEATWLFEPSTDWAQAGPIIEREGITVDYISASHRWDAWTPAPEQTKGAAFGTGTTPLIAAMRCYIASKLGDVVDIPEILMQQVPS